MQDKTNSVFGIDVSHYNTVTDWNAVKGDGVKFVYAKATDGLTFLDPTCDSNVKGAKSVGLPVGLYHFARPSNDPVQEAKRFASILDQYTLENKPVVDLEESASGVDLVNWVRTFIQTLNRATILYTGNWFIDQYNITGLSDLQLWTAYYNDNAPYDCGGWTKWTMWQYSETGKINGISGDVDLNVAVSLEAIAVPTTSTLIHVYAKGKDVSDYGVLLANGSTIVPVRAVCDAFGIKVGWDSNCNMIIVGSTLLQSTQIRGGVGYALSRELATAINKQINWNGTTKTVTFT